MLNVKSKLFHFILILIVALFFNISCNENPEPNFSKVITVIDENNEPISNVRVLINNKSYETSKDGKVIVYVSSQNDNIQFTLEKEGYQHIQLIVPSSFIGLNDEYSLKKIQEIIAEPDTIVLNEPEIEEAKVTIAESTKRSKKKEKVKEKDTEVEEVVPKNYKEIFLEAEANKEAGNWKEAIDLYNSIKNDDLDLYTQAKFNIGLIKQTQLNQFEESIKNYSDALSTNNPKNFAEIYFNRGVCYYLTNDMNNAALDFRRSFAYKSYFTGSPKQLKQKQHDLLYLWADALTRKANLEDDKTRQLNYYKDAVNKIQDYLDKFEGYDIEKSKQMKANLKNFSTKIDNSIN